METVIGAASVAPNKVRPVLLIGLIVAAHIVEFCSIYLLNTYFTTERPDNIFRILMETWVPFGLLISVITAIIAKVKNSFFAAVVSVIAPLIVVFAMLGYLFLVAIVAVIAMIFVLSGLASF